MHRSWRLLTPASPAWALVIINRCILLTQKRLKEILRYDPETGVWTHSTGGHGKHVGEIAGTITVHGYRQLCIDYVRYRSARLAFLYMTGKWPKCEAEHENRIRHDDRWSNLRDWTVAQNAMNRAVSPRNKLGFKGVSIIKRSGLYGAFITRNGKSRNLGEFKTPELAQQAFIDAGGVI
jgi:hypothetical protein